MERNEDLWIGIDGGATSVKAVSVSRTGERGLGSLGPGIECVFPGAETFRPLPIGEQLAQGDSRTMSDAERAEAAGRVEVYADAVLGVLRGQAPGRLRIALCAPGRPDRDGTGLIAVRNGPRHPCFLADLERVLKQRGLGCAGMPATIESDGTAATWGEEYGDGGAFAGVDSAYALGCGTGLAESLKLGGRLCEAWEFPGGWTRPWDADEPGAAPCAEDRLSMAACVRRWRKERASHAFPEQAARAGDPAGRRHLADWAAGLGAFLAARMLLLHRLEQPLERVVLAQRAAGLYADPALVACVAGPLQRALAAELEGAGLGALYLTGGLPNPGLLVASRLRAAPALGAVARALSWPARGA